MIWREGCLIEPSKNIWVCRIVFVVVNHVILDGLVRAGDTIVL